MKFIILTLALSTVPVCNAQDLMPSTTPAAAIAATAIQAETFTISSKILGEVRRINVYLPQEYSAKPEIRLPVLYMPDGGLQEDFTHVVDAVDSLSAWGGMRPVIVVGIENTQRRRDMTGPTDVSTDKKIASVVGGSAEFRQFIANELIPIIKLRYRTTEETGLIGESLAGLFVVETFLLDPQLFDHYIALSPSLWWNDSFLVKNAMVKLKDLKADDKSLYIASANEPGIAPQSAQLAEIISTVKDKKNLNFEFHPMPDEYHGTIYRAASPRALRKSFTLPGAIEE